MSGASLPTEKKKRARSDGGDDKPGNKRRGSTGIHEKPLVALLDGRECSVELEVLKDVAVVAFCDAQRFEEVHIRVLNDAVAILTWDTVVLTKEDLMKFKSLRHIVRIGSTVHNVDIMAAGELGIAVSNVPAYGIEERADSTLSLILNLYRKTYWLGSMVAQGARFLGPEQVICAASNAPRIRGDTLGIVGFGSVGMAVALRAQAFGFTVIIFDPYLPDGLERSFGLTRVYSLRELLSQSDCVTLHCPGNSGNVHMINEDTLKQMRKGAYLINIAHASLVDEEALASALTQGQLHGAALDVRESPKGNFLNGPLSRAPNLICTPQSASLSDPGISDLRHMAANEVRRGITGRIPEALRDCVNLRYLENSEAEREPVLVPLRESGATDAGISTTPLPGTSNPVGTKRNLTRVKARASEADTPTTSSAATTESSGTIPSTLRLQQASANSTMTLFNPNAEDTPHASRIVPHLMNLHTFLRNLEQSNANGSPTDGSQ